MEVICFKEIFSVIEEEKEIDKILWGCNELISFMAHLKKAQESKDEEAKIRVGDCIRLLLAICFPEEIYLKGETFEDYFLSESDTISDLEEEDREKIFSCYIKEVEIGGNNVETEIQNQIFFDFGENDKY